MDKISIGCILIFLAVLGALISIGSTVWLSVFGAVFLAASVMIYLGIRNGEYSFGAKRFSRRKAHQTY